MLHLYTYIRRQLKFVFFPPIYNWILDPCSASEAVKSGCGECGRCAAKKVRSDKSSKPCEQLKSDATETCSGRSPGVKFELNGTRSQPKTIENDCCTAEPKSVVGRVNSNTIGRTPSAAECSGGKSTAPKTQHQLQQPSRSPSETEILATAQYVACGYLRCS